MSGTLKFSRVKKFGEGKKAIEQDELSRAKVVRDVCSNRSESTNKMSTGSLATRVREAWLTGKVRAQFKSIEELQDANSITIVVGVIFTGRNIISRRIIIYIYTYPHTHMCVYVCVGVCKYMASRYI